MTVWIRETSELIDMFVNFASSSPWFYFVVLGIVILLVEILKEMIV